MPQGNQDIAPFIPSSARELNQNSPLKEISLPIKKRPYDSNSKIKEVQYSEDKSNENNDYHVNYLQNLIILFQQWLQLTKDRTDLAFKVGQTGSGKIDDYFEQEENLLKKSAILIDGLTKIDAGSKIIISKSLFNYDQLPFEQKSAFAHFIARGIIESNPSLDLDAINNMFDQIMIKLTCAINYEKHVAYEGWNKHINFNTDSLVSANQETCLTIFDQKDILDFNGENTDE